MKTILKSAVILLCLATTIMLMISCNSIEDGIVDENKTEQNEFKSNYGGIDPNNDDDALYAGDSGLGNDDIYDKGMSDDNGINTNEGASDNGTRTSYDNKDTLIPNNDTMNYTTYD